MGRRTALDGGTPENPKREDFLLKMYDQMFNDINRHIVVVWQSLSVVVGTLALLALIEKNVLNWDLGVTIIVVACGWLTAHVYDSSYWYNRNLTIIANIERQFLNWTDLRDIHYYFGEHRKKVSMLRHLRLQYFLAIAISVLFVVHHFVLQVLPGIGAPWNTFRFEASLPYIAVIITVSFICWFRSNRIKAYSEFLKNSPGIEVETIGIEYGTGHPTEPKNNSEADNKE